MVKSHGKRSKNAQIGFLQKKKIGSIFCYLLSKSANLQKLALFDRELQKIEPKNIYFFKKPICAFLFLFPILLTICNSIMRLWSYDSKRIKPKVKSANFHF